MIVYAYGQRFKSMELGRKGFQILQICGQQITTSYPSSHYYYICIQLKAYLKIKNQALREQNTIWYAEKQEKLNRSLNSMADKNFIIVDYSKGLKMCRVDYPNKHNIEKVIKQFDQYIGLGKQVIQEISEYQQFNYQSDQEQLANNKYQKQLLNKQLLYKISQIIKQAYHKVQQNQEIQRNGTTADNNHCINLKIVHQLSNGIDKSKKILQGLSSKFLKIIIKILSLRSISGFKTCQKIAKLEQTTGFVVLLDQVGLRRFFSIYLNKVNKIFKLLRFAFQNQLIYESMPKYAWDSKNCMVNSKITLKFQVYLNNIQKRIRG